MSPARWQEVESLLQAALERQPAERGAFLDEACAGDDALRKEVEFLLASSEQVQSFIESPALEDAAALIADENGNSMLGRRIGAYQIISLLGAGGMGEVYLAQDTRLGRKAAIKLLPTFFIKDEERVRRFKQEARAASALNHPNVATIYEIGETDEATYIAMEYVEGQTIAAKINGRPLDSTQIVEIAGQVADALDEAHNRGITHRDIKSENIMVNERGHAKVLDFGLAKIRASEAPASEIATMNQTAPGIVLGTVQYMSPEQALGKELDGRTDIFSLGVVMYEMATGRLPFSGTTAAETIERITHGQPEAIARLNYEVTAELERIIRKCLEKDRERRYQTAHDLLIDLNNLKRDSDTRALATANTIPHRQSNLWRWTSVAASVLLALGVGAYLLLVHNKGKNRVGGAAMKSIAVLPFKPVVASNRDESLEMGMADTLITRLSNIKQIIVRPISAVRNYGGLDQDAMAAGREQRVDAVLDGNIQKSGEQIRVTVRLVNIADGQQLWVDKFDEKMTNIFAVQDSISERVAAALAVKLSGEETEFLTKRYTSNTEAYQLYVKGRYLWNKRTGEALRKSIEYFNQAIEKDPNYALAYAGLADAYAVLPGHGRALPEETLPKAKAAAQKALDIDSQLPEAHTTLASLSADEWDWAEADRRFKRALELNPNYPTAHQWYGEYLVHVGRLGEALQEFKRALELDPTSLIINSLLGEALYLDRRYDEAIDQLQKTLEMDPNFAVAHTALGLAYEQKSMHNEAKSVFEKAVNLSGGATNLVALLGVAHVKCGNKSEARNVLDKLNKLVIQKRAQPHDLAIIYTGLGNKDRAFEWLEKAYQERSWLILYLKTDPFFDPLRSDPRFKGLLSRAGIPQ
ncbi:MAG: protein kinase [Acidobacteriota bacterium]